MQRKTNPFLYFKRSKEDQRGMSLIEVIIAMGIIALITLGSAPLFATALRNASASSTTTAVTTQVQGAVEDARTTPVTCASLISNKTSGAGTLYPDGRGNMFSVKVTLPGPGLNGCVPNATQAQSIPLRVEAISERTGKRIMMVDTKIFIVAGLV